MNVGGPLNLELYWLCDARLGGLIGEAIGIAVQGPAKFIGIKVKV